MAKTIIGGTSRDMETRMGRWSPLKLLMVCMCTFYNTCVAKPYCNFVDGPSASVGLSCGVFFHLPVSPSASARGNIFWRQHYFHKKSTAWFLTACHPLRWIWDRIAFRCNNITVAQERRNAGGQNWIWNCSWDWETHRSLDGYLLYICIYKFIIIFFPLSRKCFFFRPTLRPT